MNNQPLVSILIPNYNKAPYLRETLDSVLAQTYTNWECIIVDDHSTDDSWDVLELYVTRDSRFKIYRRPDHLPKGGNASRNYAFEMSKGQYVNWFDSDDIMEPLMLEQKVVTLINFSDLDFVICDLRVFKDSVSNSYRFKDLDLSQKNINYPLEALKGNFWIGTPLPMFKREFLLNCDLFNTSLIRGQEAEFFNRILLRNPSFVFLDNVKVFWRQAIKSKTNFFNSSDNFAKSNLVFSAHELIIKQFEKYNRLDSCSITFFNKILSFHFKYLNLFSVNYIRLIFLYCFYLKTTRFDIPLKIIFRRFFKIENW